MKKYFYTLIAITFVLNSFSQSPFWIETFGTGCNQGQLASGYNPSTNGTWTVTNLAASFPFPSPLVNDWFISATESGVGISNCGNSCLSTGGNNRTLHVGQNNPSSSQVDNGAYYSSSVIGTNKRVESPLINCSGESNICLSFNYILIGVSGTDYAEVLYSPNGGLTWISIGVAPPTATCSTNKSIWSTYTVGLSGSVDNNPNVKIGFRWQCSTNANNVVSFAVDDITLKSLPLTTFSPNFAMVFPLCENSTSTLTANTGTYAVSGYTWSVNPSGPIISAPNSSTTPISFPTPGTFSITLTATSGTQIASNTQTAVVTPSAAVAASINPNINSICFGKTATITAYGNAMTYTWFPLTTTVNPIVVSPTVTTTYTTIGTNSLGCTGTRSITLYVNPTPTVTVSGPTVSCSGNTVCLNATINPPGPAIYNWVGPCGYFSTQISPCFTPSTSCGCTMTLVIQNISSCIGSGTFCVNVSACTEVSEYHSENDFFSIFPNPSSDKIHIRANKSGKNIIIKLVDVIGREQIQSELFDLIPEEVKIVDIDRLNRGIYFVRIISEESEIYTQFKILKE